MRTTLTITALLIALGTTTAAEARFRGGLRGFGRTAAHAVPAHPMPTPRARTGVADPAAAASATGSIGAVRSASVGASIAVAAAGAGVDAWGTAVPLVPSAPSAASSPGPVAADGRIAKPYCADGRRVGSGSGFCVIN